MHRLSEVSAGVRQKTKVSGCRSTGVVCAPFPARSHTVPKTRGGFLPSRQTFFRHRHRHPAGLLPPASRSSTVSKRRGGSLPTRRKNRPHRRGRVGCQKRGRCRKLSFLPGVGRAHKPCAAALSCEHSEHRRCKMCGSCWYVWVFRQSDRPHRRGAGQRTACRAQKKRPAGCRVL